MTRAEISQRLQLHTLNLCLAAAAGKEGDIKTTIKALGDEVEQMLNEEWMRARRANNP